MSGSVRRVCLLLLNPAALLGFLFCCLQPSFAADPWPVRLEPVARQIAANAAGIGAVYVGEPYDGSRDAAYYPFMETVRQAVTAALSGAGLKVGTAPTDAGGYLRLAFRAVPEELRLDVQLTRIADGSVLATAAIAIPAAQLPADWRRRDLRDVAHELALKLEEATIGERILVAVGEFSGGATKDAGLVSPFGEAIKSYLRDELSCRGSIAVATPGAAAVPAQAGPTGAAVLAGRYFAVGNEVVLELSLSRPGKQATSVSARFPLAALPPGMPLFPDNAATAKQFVDPAGGAEGYRPEVEIHVWTDRTEYRDGDRLVVHLRPARDCYARVFYIQSDGQIAQIFPGRRDASGQLRGNVEYQVGGPNDAVELIVNDQTTGQEFLKVFASTDPIDDAALPRDVAAGAGVLVVRGGYADVKRGMTTRGIGGAARPLLPVAEAKILVEKKNAR